VEKGRLAVECPPEITKHLMDCEVARWMDEWVDGFTARWLYGLMNGWIYCEVALWMDGFDARWLYA
jgi:hypothetical protein